MDAVQAVPASGPLRSLNFDHFQIVNVQRRMSTGNNLCKT